MLKHFLIMTLALMCLGIFGAFAQDRDRREHRDRDDHRRTIEYRQLRAEIDQLNRMFAHVSAELRYRSGPEIRRDYSRLLRDADRLNYKFQRSSYDRLRVHAQIDRIRDELREIEVRLRVRRHFHWR